MYANVMKMQTYAELHSKPTNKAPTKSAHWLVLQYDLIRKDISGPFSMCFMSDIRIYTGGSHTLTLQFLSDYVDKYIIFINC